MAQLIEMPKLSDTMTVGTVVKWHKSKGDDVANGDVLAEIETDKATMDLESFEDGILLEVFVEEGSEAPIGSPLAAVGHPGEDISALSPKASDQIEQDSPADETATVDEGFPIKENLEQNFRDDETQEDDSGEIPSDEISNNSSERIFASPLAKKIAKEKNIDLSKIKGSGPHGRVLKKDLGSPEQPTENPTTQVQVESEIQPPLSTHGLLEEKSVPLSKMRSVIASRLLESKTTIPHFYLQKEIDSRPLRLARESINQKLAARQLAEEPLQKITLNDLVLKATTEAIKWNPEINTSWADTQINYHGNINLAFGVAVEGGLLTPVIRNCENLSLTSLSNQAKLLIAKARDKKLLPDEMSGSTFTVTNLGMFGVDFFSGIINPPNAAILSIGSSVQKPVVDSFGSLVPGETMILGLSCDHRLIDGATAAKFLGTLAENLATPSSMLV